MTMSRQDHSRLGPLFVALILGLLLSVSTMAPAAGSCTNERPQEVFEALEAIDEAGEAELKQKLDTLSRREAWTQTEWEDNVAALAEAPGVAEREARRDELVAQLFGLLARPPYDCELLDALEAEILALEQQQWQASVDEVERRLKLPPQQDTL